MDELDIDETDFLQRLENRNWVKYLELTYDQMMLDELELNHDEIFVIPSTGGTSPVQIYY
ncbi:hypothetical protein [Photobacterium leiognathi]|uniref:hypothetical protein n=1 Tax=Photobacterium leiognathi TaxID=553611 RepID=UPI0029824C0A|nr:hypothetical protein [Photobacterium leiognathi]